RLASLLPGVDVVNAGTPGYDLGQEYLYFKDRGYRFEPDLVLLGFFVNDLARASELDETDPPDGLPTSYQRKAERLQRDRAEQGRGVRGAVTSWLNDHSLLYVLVRRHMENFIAHREARGAPGTGQAEKREAPPYYLSVFRDDPGEATARDWRRAYRIL